MGPSLERNFYRTNSSFLLRYYHAPTLGIPPEKLLGKWSYMMRKPQAAAAIRKWALRLFPDDGYVNYYQVFFFP